MMTSKSVCPTTAPDFSSRPITPSPSRIYFFSFFSFFYFLHLTTVLSQLGFSHGESRIAFLGESQLRQSRDTQPTVHAGCFSVSIIRPTRTWTTGSLTCAEMLMHAIAHGGVRVHVRVCTESSPWETNPLPHRGIEPASAACRSDILSTELHPHPCVQLEGGRGGVSSCYNSLLLVSVYLSCAKRTVTLSSSHCFQGQRVCSPRRETKGPHFLLPSFFVFVSGPFNRILFHKFSRQLSAFSLCSSGLISALLVLSTIYLFMKASLSPDIILCG